MENLQSKNIHTSTNYSQFLDIFDQKSECSSPESNKNIEEFMASKDCANFDDNQIFKDKSEADEMTSMFQLKTCYSNLNDASSDLTPVVPPKANSLNGSSLFPSLLYPHEVNIKGNKLEKMLEASIKSVGEPTVEEVKQSYSSLEYSHALTGVVPHLSLPVLESSSCLKSSFAISNIVSVANLNCTIDLKSVAQNCRNCEYQPSRFPGLVMRLKTPKATANIFSTGKLGKFTSVNV